MKTMEYLFGHGEQHAYLTIQVPGQSDWTEEEWDSAAESEIKQYALNPEEWFVSEVFEMEKN